MMAKQLENAKANAWKHWTSVYVHCLMESDRLNKETGTISQVGEIVLMNGDEKNCREKERWCILSRAKMTLLEW